MSRKLTLRLTKSKCTYRSSEPSNSVPYCQASPIRSLDFTKWDSATTAIWRRTVVEEFADTISTSPASKCACQRSPKQTASLFCRPAAAKLARRSLITATSTSRWPMSSTTGHVFPDDASARGVCYIGANSSRVWPRGHAPNANRIQRALSGPPSSRWWRESLAEGSRGRWTLPMELFVQARVYSSAGTSRQGRSPGNPRDYAISALV